MAIKLLKEFHGNRTVDDHWIEPKWRDRGQQNNVVLRYLQEIQRADNVEIEAGFTSVMTDFVGSVCKGSIPDPEYYERLERQWKRRGAS